MKEFNLDPRAKLVISFCLSILAVFFNEPGQLLLLLAFAFVFTGFFGVNLIKTILRFRGFLPLLIMLLAVQTVFAPSGEVLITAGPLSIITTGGLAAGFSIIIRMLILLISALFLMTSTPRDLVLGLIKWKVPYEIAFMVSLGLSFIPMFSDEVKDALIAIQLRGRDIKKSSFRDIIGLISTLFFPIIYGVLVKAQKITIAMEARGFRAYKRRTCLRELSFRKTDYLFSFFFLLGTFAIVLFEFI